MFANKPVLDKSDLMVTRLRVNETLITVITVHPVWGVFTTMNGKTSKSCGDISLKTTNINHMVALEEKSEVQIYRLETTNVYKMCRR